MKNHVHKRALRRAAISTRESYTNCNGRGLNVTTAVYLVCLQHHLQASQERETRVVSLTTLYHQVFGRSGGCLESQARESLLRVCGKLQTVSRAQKIRATHLSSMKDNVAIQPTRRQKPDRCRGAKFDTTAIDILLDHLFGDGGDPLGKTCVPPRVRLQAGLHHVKGNDGQVSRRAADCPARREEPKIDRRQASLLRKVSEGLQAARSVKK